MAEISKRRRIWGWWFFDWASQPYHTLLVTFVFGPYFAGVAAGYFTTEGLDAQAAAARAQTVWANCLTITGLIIAATLVSNGGIGLITESVIQSASPLSVVLKSAMVVAS